MTQKLKKFVVYATTAAAMGIIGLPAIAQDFPAETIRVVSGFPAGGGTDAIARQIAQGISEKLGNSVVVENRPGAGGGVAAAYVKNMQPDGYTILQTISGTVTVEPAFEELEYNLEDFKYLGAVVQFQEAIVARADSEWATLGELLESGAEATFGSQGRLDHVMVERINIDHDPDILIVPFGGGPDIIAAILGGHIDMGWSGTLHVPLIEAGEMIALAVPGEERYAAYPDAPTLTELGFPLALNMYSIFAVPADTPDDIVAMLSEAVLEAAQSTEFLELTARYNFKPILLDSEETHAVLTQQFENASAAIEATR